MRRGPYRRRTVSADELLGAVCGRCGQHMGIAQTCTDTGSFPYGDEYAHLRVVNPEAFADFDPLEHCRDCGVPLGGHHHRGCCIALCATCGGQSMADGACDGCGDDDA